ncbi:hypothetical protein [Nocardia nova]|uniref:hypothetical protein n=1 Tax=Nocardia nova TaxID=37330 RepID=UPI0033C1796A
MTEALTNPLTTEAEAPTSQNDTSPPTRRQVGVRELRAGDVIAHEIGLAGRVEITRVTAELAPDLTRVVGRAHHLRHRHPRRRGQHLRTDQHSPARLAQRLLAR